MAMGRKSCILIPYFLWLKILHYGLPKKRFLFYANAIYMTFFDKMDISYNFTMNTSMKVKR